MLENPEELIEFQRRCINNALYYIDDWAGVEEDDILERLTYLQKLLEGSEDYES